MIQKYPDGTSYAQINKLAKNVKLTYRINSYEDLWHLGQLLDAYNNNGETPIVFIPNLIDAQADKRFHDNESSGLKLVCNFLNQFKAHYHIFHPHNPEVVEALLKDVTIINNTYFIKQVLDDIYKMNNPDEKIDAGLWYYQKLDNLVLMSADAGGFKPLMKLCDEIKWAGHTASASKSRKYENNQSIITQQIAETDFQGKDVLIIDDICVYGGTFKGLAKLLKERNVGNIYLATSHMTIQNLGQDPVINYFDKVYTTNSKYIDYIAEGVYIGSESLKVINIYDWYR